MRKPRIDWNAQYTEDLTYRQYAKQQFDNGRTWEDIGAELGLQGDAVRCACKYIPRKTVTNEATPEFPDKIAPTATWRESLDFAVESAEFHKKHEYWQDEATATVKTDKPIICVYTSDWHLGSLATDHAHFKKWIEAVLGTEGVYLICAGPDIESRGHFRSILPTLHQVFGPEIQQRVFAQIWQELTDAGKLLAGCWDNHSIEQYEKLIGFSPLAQMMAKDIPYFRGRGTLHLQTGEQTYTHRLTHNTRFNSSYNTTHGLKQEARMSGFAGDVVVAGHIHNPAVEMCEGKVYIRTGTMKNDDSYSVRYFDQGVFACPCVVFSPTCKEMTPFWTLEQAVRYRGVA